MQRSFPASLLTSGLVELELQDVAQEVAQIGRVARNVVLRAGIEGVCRARGRWYEALIFQAEIPP